jgi:putative MATE family efflux protein
MRSPSEVVAAPSPPRIAPPGLADSTRRLLDAKIVPTLFRLAAPNVAVMVVQAGISTFDAFILGWLGADALAGVALAFPVLMLLQTMSAGGMGGGVASAIARALGAGRRRDGDALVAHALVIATGMGALFMLVMLVAGPALYGTMGGTGATLAAALAYSNVVFAGALAPWYLNTLAAVVRGTGQMTLPAIVFLGGGALHLVLSPALAFGWGPLPRLGVAGAAFSMITWYALGSLVLLGYLWWGRSLVRLSVRGFRLERRLFGDILRVGAFGSLNTIQTNLTVLLLTGLVGPFGTFALAGYGLGARLEYLQIPLVFGFGSALVTMVGTNIGAGQRTRARRVAWTGGAMAAAVTGSIGLLGALAPGAWLGLFTTEPAVLAAGARYLTVVGPTYGFFGLGLALYFASQGAGRMLWPLLGGFLRLALAAVGGWLVVHRSGGGLDALFGVIALAFIVFGATVALGIRRW